jgi:hypothetical protein
VDRPAYGTEWRPQTWGTTGMWMSTTILLGAPDDDVTGSSWQPQFPPERVTGRGCAWYRGVSMCIPCSHAGELTVEQLAHVETREHVGGFWVVDAPDLDLALKPRRRAPGRRRVGVRPIVDPPSASRRPLPVEGPRESCRQPVGSGARRS